MLSAGRRSGAMPNAHVSSCSASFSVAADASAAAPAAVRSSEGCSRTRDASVLLVGVPERRRSRARSNRDARRAGRRVRPRSARQPSSIRGRRRSSRSSVPVARLNGTPLPLQRVHDSAAACVTSSAMPLASAASKSTIHARSPPSSASGSSVASQSGESSSSSGMRLPQTRKTSRRPAA